MAMFKRAAVIVLASLYALAQAPGPVQAESIVKHAVNYAKKNGMDKLIAQPHQTDGRFQVGTGSALYLFIYDQTGVCKAIGYNSQALVGVNRIDVKDPAGKPYVRDLIALAKAKGAGWVDYQYPNPLHDNKIEPKTSYVELCDGLVVGCGVYK